MMLKDDLISTVSLLRKLNSSCARLLMLLLDENLSLTLFPTTDEPSDTLILLSSKTIPSNFLWKLTQLLDTFPFDVGNLAMITGGNNLGRIGV